MTSRIENLENQLRDAIADRDRLLSSISECESKLKASKEILPKRAKQLMEDRKELIRVKDEVVKAKASFGEHERKYQAFRDIPLFNCFILTIQIYGISATCAIVF